MNKVVLEVIFSIGTVSSKKIWEFLVFNKIIEDKYINIINNKVELESVGPILGNRFKDHFEIKTKDFSVSYNTIIQRGHILFEIDFFDKFEYDSWNKYLNLLYQEFGFQVGRIYDYQFNYWQNVQNPSQYERVGKEYNHMQLITNNLPSPLTKNILDTSKNPGRRVIKNGYVEAVSSHMWVGEKLWDALGSNNENNIMKLKNKININKENGLIQIIASKSIYTEECHNPEILNLLRNSIF